MKNQRARRHSGLQSAMPAARHWAILVLSALAWPTLAEVPDEQEADWTLRKETSNITIYTASTDDSRFRAFKAEALLDAPIENVMAVMVTPESCMEWVHNCSEARNLGEGTFHERYAYSASDMPWPVSDRDYVLRLRTEGEKASGEITMRLTAVPDRREEEDGMIRVDDSDTLYQFKPEGDKTRMLWLQHTDPNGSLPSWLVNTLLVDIPLRSLENLERVAGLDHYQGFRLIYDEQGKLVDVLPPSADEDDVTAGKR